MLKSRDWHYFPIVMPLDRWDQGPVDLPKAAKLTWEVWDRNTTSHGSFAFLPDAIDCAMALNMESGNGLWTLPTEAIAKIVADHQPQKGDQK